MLTINDIHFSYSSSSPYRFDLQVNPGEILGISGASGSGKSTLLDLIAGFQKPLTGQIKLDDTIISNHPAEERPVSILFQKENVFAHLTASENVKLGTNQSISEIEKLDEVGLAPFAHQKCAKLSGGQQQRVALARTLARNQPILLLDEPFSALDDDTAKQMRALVKKMVHHHKWHTILVSHHQADFDALADRLMQLRDGTLRSAK